MYLLCISDSFLEKWDPLKRKQEMSVPGNSTLFMHQSLEERLLQKVLCDLISQ